MAELLLFPDPDNGQPEADEILPPDWRARTMALDARQSWIVEAPAGSGKTGLLMQRFLKLLADESVQQPEQVLAITFTIKATAEMRDRIVEQLRLASGPDQSRNPFERETRALAQTVLARDQNLGWSLLNHPRRLNIRTIDSVCAEIARSLPVLSGSGGQLSPVEDASALHREAARRTLMQFGGADSDLNNALRTLLLHRNGSLKNCEELLAEILALRDQWGQLVPLSISQLDDAYLDGTVRSHLERTLDLAVEAGLARLIDMFTSDTLDELALLASEMGSAPGYNGQPSPIQQCADAFTTPQATAEDLQHWRGLIHLLITKDGWRRSNKRNHLRFEIEKPHADRLKELQDRLRNDDELLAALKQVAALPPSRYPEDQWLVAKALFRTLSRALVELQIVFAERGECDFTELGLLARTALNQDGSSEELAQALGMNIQHLLVDEVQDTSTSQYNLIELLTQGWDGRSQTVFLVGDPKQSIYLFRQARVERFVRTMLSGELGELVLGRLQLTANFRSQAALVNVFNGDFARIFPNETNSASPEDVPYVEAAPIRTTNTAAQHVVWHSNVLPNAKPGDQANAAKRAQAILDAQSIRSTIEQWRKRPLPHHRQLPWKIAVLVRSRNLLNDIVAELKAAAIPYRAVDIEILGERQEVLDLFALTRALLHPADRTAWLAVLRAPWCGLGLAELHMLAGADDPAYAKRSIKTIIAERGHLLSEESYERLARLWPIMQAAAAKRSLLTAAQLVERTWRSLGGDAYLGMDESRNADRYLQLLDALEAETGSIDLGLLKRRMENLFANAHSTEDAVDLMTIHGAKGLEWDVVIVPGLERTSKKSGGQLLTWEEFDYGGSDAAHVVLAPIEGKGEASQILNTWLKSIHAARDAAEQKRVFYVACTRAREELHLFAAPMINTKGEINPSTGTLLKAAWPAAQEHLRVPSPAIIQMPGAPAALSRAQEDSSLDLAAAADNTNHHPRLERLPLTFDPQARFTTESLSPEKADSTPTSAFTRPDGSLQARAFGDAVHVFLEALAKRASQGAVPDALIMEVVTWKPRILALLRSDGLTQSVLERYSEQVMTALTNTLHDERGRWILATQNHASTELPLNAWNQDRTSFRLDRVFRAGLEPLSTGDDCIWIVDYKTATHGADGIEAFLTNERAKYEMQLESYAQMIRSTEPHAEIRVGLYFPLLPELVWWKPLTNPKPDVLP